MLKKASRLVLTLALVISFFTVPGYARENALTVAGETLVLEGLELNPDDIPSRMPEDYSAFEVALETRVPENDEDKIDELREAIFRRSFLFVDGIRAPMYRVLHSDGTLTISAFLDWVSEDSHIELHYKEDETEQVLVIQEGNWDGETYIDEVDELYYYDLYNEDDNVTFAYEGLELDPDNEETPEGYTAFNLIFNIPEDKIGQIDDAKMSLLDNVYVVIDGVKTGIYSVTEYSGETTFMLTGYAKEVSEDSSLEIYNRYEVIYVGERYVADLPKLPKAIEGSLYDLERAKNVSAKVTGESIDYTQVELTNKEDEDVTVHISAGTWFDASSSSVQNMLVRNAVSVTLGPKETRTVSVPTACMNIDSDIPEQSDGFRVKYDDNSLETKLTEYAAENDVSYDVFQAALWIITDNSTDSRLRSSLVNSYGAEIISQDEINAARDIVEQLK
jgi:hypothetical protein